ncbi:MAG: Crp/Fnr family transcriptional regulator [Clostridiales bacterium]|nr:Crp/Fnr family transcriptional regulator [Clostridiales bacterium]
MEKILPVLHACPLFDGIDAADLKTLLDCLSATRRRCEKNEFVFLAGDRVTLIGIVLSGGVRILQEDFWGNRAILDNIGPGGLFGEAFSCAEVEHLPVSVMSVLPSDILLVDYRRIITTCSSACVFHARLIRNMLHIMAEKNVRLTQKMEILTRRSTREKLLRYLSAQAQQTGGSSFTIPFNRQELAEYLAIDRSAMSKELSKMQQDGLLRVDRSRFELL